MSEPSLPRHVFPRAGGPLAAASSSPSWASAPSPSVRPLVLGRASRDLESEQPVVPTDDGGAAPRPAEDPEPADGHATSTSARPRASSVAPSPERASAAEPAPAAPSDLGSSPSATSESDAQRALLQAAQLLERARPGVLAVVEHELLELAVDIASVLVEDELLRRPELHRALVRAALAGVEPGPGVRVRASRATYDALLEAFDRAAIDAGRGRVSVELDASLEGAGAVVDVDGASIDGRAETRLETLRAALRQGGPTRRAA